jgi:ribosomal protein L7/L12
MRTLGQAREAAVAHLATMKVCVVLLDSNTEEFDAGWVFYYQSAQYVLTQQIGDMLAGNAPIFVPRNGAPPHFISYLRPTSESVEAFVRCGDANAVQNPEVELLGYEAGALTVPVIRLIRDCSSLGLAAAKEAVEACLCGTPTRLQTTSAAAARELVAKLADFHFIARVTYSPKPQQAIESK